MDDAQIRREYFKRTGVMALSVAGILIALSGFDIFFTPAAANPLKGWLILSAVIFGAALVYLLIHAYWMRDRPLFSGEEYKPIPFLLVNTSGIVFLVLVSEGSKQLNGKEVDWLQSIKTLIFVLASLLPSMHFFLKWQSETQKNLPPTSPLLKSKS